MRDWLRCGVRYADGELQSERAGRLLLSRLYGLFLACHRLHHLVARHVVVVPPRNSTLLLSLLCGSLDECVDRLRQLSVVRLSFLSRRSACRLPVCDDNPLLCRFVA